MSHGCCGRASKDDGKQRIPVDWLISTNRQPHMVFFGGLGLHFVCQIIFHVTELQEDGEELDSLWLALTFGTVLWCIIGLLSAQAWWHPVVTEVGGAVSLLGAAICESFAPVANDLAVFANYSIGFHAFLFLLLPACVGWRLRVACPFLLLNYIAQCVAHVLLDRKHPETPADTGLIGLGIIYLTASVVICWQRRRMRNLFEAETQFRTEKKAFELLLDNVCDATVWLDKDGDTVVECSRNFDILMRRELAGHAFSSCLQDSEEERLRLRGAIKRAVRSPLALHVTLVSGRGVATEYELFIIDRSAAQRWDDFSDLESDDHVMGHVGSLPRPAAERNSPLKRTFLVGVRNAGHAFEAIENPKSIALDSHWKHPRRSWSQFMEDVMSQLPQNAEDADATLRHRLEQIAQAGKREHWLIDDSQIHVLPNAEIGRGGFGYVRAARWHGMTVAMKVPIMNNDSMRQRGQEENRYLATLVNELRVLRHVRHPNVVLFYGACIIPEITKLCLLFEFVNGVVLHKYMGKTGREAPDALVRFDVTLEICYALSYLHGQEPPIVHGDLKHSNIMVEVSEEGNRGRTKVLDFGLSRVITPHAKRLGGTPAYAAPELVLDPNVHPAPTADVFSFGRIVYLVITGKVPFKGINGEELLQAIRTRKPRELTWPDPEQVVFRQEAQSLVEKCCSWNEADRPDIRMVRREVSNWPLHLSRSMEEFRSAFQSGGSPASPELSPGPSPRSHRASIGSVPEDAVVFTDWNNQNPSPRSRRGSLQSRRSAPTGDEPPNIRAVLSQDELDMKHAPLKPDDDDELEDVKHQQPHDRNGPGMVEKSSL